MAANRYQQGDKAPLIYKTSDYGRTWTKIVNGIAPDHFVRVVREDPEKRGLLYAGTERGVVVSFDDGMNWTSLRKNLPMVPVHDLRVKDGDSVKVSADLEGLNPGQKHAMHIHQFGDCSAPDATRR